MNTRGLQLTLDYDEAQVMAKLLSNKLAAVEIDNPNHPPALRALKQLATVDIPAANPGDSITKTLEDV